MNGIATALSRVETPAGATIAAYRISRDKPDDTTVVVLWVLDDTEGWTTEQLDNLCELAAGAVPVEIYVLCSFADRDGAASNLDRPENRLVWTNINWPMRAASQ